MDYEKKYKEALERARIWQNHLHDTNDKDYANELNYIFPELAESGDEKIRKQILSFLKEFEYDHYRNLDFSAWIAWLEKQGDKDSQVKLPTFTFDDILALQCCMETVKKVQNDKDLYEKLNDLHGRIYDAYYLEKQGEQNPYSGVSFKYNGHAWGMCARDGGVEILMDGNLKAFISLDKSFIYPISSQSALEAVKEEKIDNQTCVKPADKFKPKFKVGDWIVFTNGNVERIISVGTHGYTFDDGDYLLHDKCDKDAHLWTIQDAKDGDVLVNGSNIFIFHFINGTRLMGYCHVNTDNGRFYDDIGKNECFCLIDAVINPATKEQRDTLFAKMKEAGYTFDFEKKELKKIKNDIEIPFGAKDSELQEATYYIPKGFYAETDNDKVVIKKGEKPAAWSEEDEKRIANILSVLSVQVCWDGATGEIMNPYQKEIDWLKSLKDRVQSKQEWSEDDKKMLESIIYDFGKGRQSTTSQDNWLKSLAPWSIPKIRFV